MAEAMSVATARCLALSTSKVSIVADISSPPFGKCSIRAVEGGVIFRAIHGQRYRIQACWKYEPGANYWMSRWDVALARTGSQAAMSANRAGRITR